jgi:hypothetical protein
VHLVGTLNENNEKFMPIIIIIIIIIIGGGSSSSSRVQLKRDGTR